MRREVRENYRKVEENHYIAQLYYRIKVIKVSGIFVVQLQRRESLVTSLNEKCCRT